jgi:hypothetical protein
VRHGGKSVLAERDFLESAVRSVFLDALRLEDRHVFVCLERKFIEFGACHRSEAPEVGQQVGAKLRFEVQFEQPLIGRICLKQV